MPPKHSREVMFEKQLQRLYRKIVKADKAGKKDRALVLREMRLVLAETVTKPPRVQ